MATQTLQPMPRTRQALHAHLHDVHGMRWSTPPSRTDLAWDHLDAHNGGRANHRHDWGNEEVRPA